ncbi:uncharacterized protein LOC125478331, partial [Pyrus x bretschneideri]|uniref:uncharacterized protein LOC125478331 n=1 Tax=Pyrus x bretschneideri TaxID=225117 RepID=UPI0020306873
MGRNSLSPPAILDDSGGADGTDLCFLSIRDRFPLKRNPYPSHQKDPGRGGFTYRQPFLRPTLRSHHLFYRKGLLWLFPFKGKSSFYVVLIFALFLFAVATLVLQSSMTLAFRQGSERGRLPRKGLKFGSTLRFVPGRVSRRFVEGDGLDRARKEARIGVRPPRLALIFSAANGKAHKMWEQLGGQISVLAPECYGLVD